MDSAVLIRMANQISQFFQAYPKAEAIDGIAKHIHNSWVRRMRDKMKTIIDNGGEGLDPLAVEALQAYFKGSLSGGKRVNVNPREPAPKGAQPSFADGGGDAG